jgi:hypothetical protein
MQHCDSRYRSMVTAPAGVGNKRASTRLASVGIAPALRGGATSS